MPVEAAQIAVFCMSSASRFINELFEWMAKAYHSMGAKKGAEVDSSQADWLFIGSAVKAVFRELHRIRTVGQLNTDPADQVWAMMSTMDLQEEMSDDFNKHRVVVEESYSHVQKNAVLKAEFTHQMAEMLEKIKRIEKVANTAMSNSQKKKDKEKDKS